MLNTQILLTVNLPENPVELWLVPQNEDDQENEVFSIYQNAYFTDNEYLPFEEPVLLGKLNIEKNGRFVYDGDLLDEVNQQKVAKFIINHGNEPEALLQDTFSFDLTVEGKAVHCTVMEDEDVYTILFDNKLVTKLIHNEDCVWEQTQGEALNADILRNIGSRIEARNF